MERWYVVFTKPRQEEHACEQLARQGFHVYLPRILLQKRRRGKWHAVIEPLFPRYLFIYVDPDQQSVAPVRSTLGVSDFVRFGGVMCEMPAKVVAYLKGQENPENGLIDPDRPQFMPGDLVEVVEGPFAGLKAVFQQEKGSDRALVLIDLLGKKSRITLRRDLLTPVT